MHSTVILNLLLLINFMTDFIEVYDNALSKDFCKDFIAQFESSPHKTTGVTGGGIDKSKKDSNDIYLNQHPEFQQPLQTILQATTKCMLDYINKYYFTLISGISLTIMSLGWD